MNISSALYFQRRKDEPITVTSCNRRSLFTVLCRSTRQDRFASESESRLASAQSTSSPILVSATERPRGSAISATSTNYERAFANRWRATTARGTSAPRRPAPGTRTPDGDDADADATARRAAAAGTRRPTAAKTKDCCVARRAARRGGGLPN